MRVPRPSRPVAASLGAGVVGALSLPPWGWWPLAVVGLGIAAWALESAGGSSQRRAMVGLAFGLGMFLPGLWWVTEFHAVGYVVLTLLQTSFFVAAFALCRAWWAFPAAVVAAEAARSAVPFGGLPLSGLALGQAGGPFVASARVGGALLVLGVVAALATLRLDVRRVVPAAVAIAIAALGWIAPAGRVLDRELDVALVQGGGPRGFRAVESDASAVFDRHLAASEDLPTAGGLDLVLWPENAVDVPLLEGTAEADELAALARRTGATVIAGVTTDAEDDADRFVNVAVVWANGDVVGRYVKAHRVPFGEYVPGRGFLERIVDLSALPRDAVAGTGNGVVRTQSGRMAVSISYEVFFAERARSGVRGGGIALLVPTNAASFTTSQVPTQEVAAARLRAWETGRWVLQAAPTGYTAVIDHRGRVLERSTLGRAEVITAAVERRVDFTWYVRLGDAPVVVAAVVILGWPLLPGFRRARRRA